MIVTWTMVIALALQPFPTIALLEEFKTREACEARIKAMDVSEEQRGRMACLAIAHDGI